MADEFTGDSGMKDDWDGVITDAHWHQQERGNWSLQLISQADDGEEVEHRPLSVGGTDKGWVSYDTAEMQNERGTNTKFHERSAIQQFINIVMKLDGADVVLRERSAGLYNRRGPMFANLWVGLRFHWDVVEETSRRPKEGTDIWED